MNVIVTGDAELIGTGYVPYVYHPLRVANS